MKREPFYIRNPSAVVISRGRALLFVLPGAPSRSFSLPDDEVGELGALLGDLVSPTAPSAIEGRVPARVLELLLREGVLCKRPSEEPAGERLAVRKVRQLPCRRLVLGVSGTAYAAFIAPIVTMLQHGFAEQLDVVFTKTAAAFVNPGAFSAFGLNVWTDLLERRADVKVPHMTLAAQADLVLVMPASAHCLHRVASGACSDLLSLVVSATRAPVVVVPTMNASMWNNPAIRRNVAHLRADGLYVVEPAAGPSISGGTDSEAEIGAPGVDQPSLLPTLKAILDHHRTCR